MSNPIVVEIINLDEGYLLLGSGEMLEIDRVLDASGDDTDDLDEADSVIAQLPDGRWMSVYLAHFVQPTFH